MTVEILHHIQLLYIMHTTVNSHSLVNPHAVRQLRQSTYENCSTHVYYGLNVWRGRLDTVFDDDSSLMVESSIAISILYVSSCLGRANEEVHL